MKTIEMSVKKLEILDLIIELLSGNRSLLLSKLETEVNNVVWRQEGAPQLSELEMVNGAGQVMSESENALDFLEKNDYVGKLDDIYYLKNKGVLKHDSGGFVGEARGTIRRNSFNYFFWVATPIVAFLSFLISIYLLFRGGL